LGSNLLRLSALTLCHLSFVKTWIVTWNSKRPHSCRGMASRKVLFKGVSRSLAEGHQQLRRGCQIASRSFGDTSVGRRNVASASTIRRAIPAAVWPDWRGSKSLSCSHDIFVSSSTGGSSSSSSSSAPSASATATDKEEQAAPSKEAGDKKEAKKVTEPSSGKEEKDPQDGQDGQDKEEKAETNADEEEPSSVKWERYWRQAVQADGVPDPSEGNGLFDSFMQWVFTKQAVRHCRYMAPGDDADGRFNDLTGDIETASPGILKFLQQSLTGARDAGKSAKGMLQTPAVEEQLSTRLEEMVDGLQQEGRDWTWEIDEVVSATCDHLHMIIAHSRSRPRGKADVLAIFRQHLVMQPEQSKRFLNDPNGKREVLMEMLVDDFIIVAVVRVLAKQRSTLAAAQRDPGSEGNSEKPEEKDEQEASEAGVEEVEHILRLELPFTQDRVAIAQDEFNARAGEWQLVDWNNICDGNHPVILPTTRGRRIRL